MQSRRNEDSAPQPGNTAQLRKLLENKIKPADPNGTPPVSLLNKEESLDYSDRSNHLPIPKSQNRRQSEPWVSSVGDPPPVPPKPGCGKSVIKTSFPHEQDNVLIPTAVDWSFRNVTPSGRPPRPPPKPPSKRKVDAKRSLSPDDYEAIEDALFEILDEDKIKLESKKKSVTKPPVHGNISQDLLEQIEKQLKRKNHSPVVSEPEQENEERNGSVSSEDASEKSSGYFTPPNHFDESTDSAQTPIVDEKTFFGSPLTPLANAQCAVVSNDMDASFSDPRDSVISDTSSQGTMNTEQSVAYAEILRQMGLVAQELQRRKTMQTGPNTDRVRRPSVPSSLGIPEGIGSIREHRPQGRKKPLLSPTHSSVDPASNHHDSTLSPGSKSKSLIVPAVSPCGSTASFSGEKTDSRVSEVSESGNEEEQTPEEQSEEKRKRRLKKIAAEFADSERTYLHTLKLLSREFPEFIRKAQTVQKGQTAVVSFDVVDQVAKKLDMIVPLHEKILGDFKHCVAEEHWNEDDPKIADVLLRHGQFLKLCSTFLRDKVALVRGLLDTQEKNPEFADAVKHFEIFCFKGLRLSDQLDCVHQRICRYPLLLTSYLKYLPEGSNEFHAAQKAKKLTEEIASSLEMNLVEGDGTRQLLELYDKLYQGRVTFDIFQPGRKLIKLGLLNKQSRKQIQQRFLLLFSDAIVYCHPSGTDSYTIKRILPLDEKTQVKTEDHEDYKNEFQIISKSRSVVMVAKDQVDKKEWVNSIRNAAKNAVKNQYRLNAFVGGNPKRKKPTDTVPVEDMSPTERSSSAARNCGQVAPVWIPDKDATMCQICSAIFTPIRRKHHCRGCGKIICSTCCGTAPIEYENNKPQKVCYACYNVIAARERKHAAKKYSGGAPELEGLLVPPPGEERKDPEDSKRRHSGCIVDGYLYRWEKKSWKKYWGVLEAGALQFYSAPKDKKYHDMFMVVGCEFVELEDEFDYSKFELRGRNQFRTPDSAERVCTLKTESSRSSQKWKVAIENLLDEFS